MRVGGQMMAVIHIDSDVILGFYESSIERMKVFDDLRVRADCFFVTEQMTREVKRNRVKKLNGLADEVEKNSSAVLSSAAIVHGLDEFAEWQAANKEAKRHADAIVKQLRDWAADESADPVFQEFVNIYKAGTTTTTPPGAIERAHRRKLIGEPPSSQGTTIGDEVIWETLLVACQQDLIIVSRDQTYFQNESVLRAEFEAAGNRRLVLVTKNLSEALAEVGKPSAAVSQAERDWESASREALDSVMCKRCKCMMESQVYRDNSGEDAVSFRCPACGNEVY